MEPNPWTRADVFQADERTLDLVKPEQRKEYLEVTGELFYAGYQLNEASVVYNAAQMRYMAALEARARFFHE